MSTEIAISKLGALATKYALVLETAMLDGGILGQLEKAHFIAQMAHETQGFSMFEENLNYSAEGLNRTFRKYFPTIESARAYARRPEKIANKVYANRFGNSGEASGDGWKYRGRGFTHLTFHNNYRDASQSIYGDTRLVSAPDIASVPAEAARIAVWYWNSRNCCGPARKDSIEDVTRAINGGSNGLDDRKAWLTRTKRVFNVA